MSLRTMEVLLLTDIRGIGKKNDLLVVANGFALNHLLPERKAIVATPSVRKRYAESITARATEREMERSLQASLSSTLAGKTVRINAKTNKAGTLYSAVSAADVVAALREQFSIDLPETAIVLKEHIKSTGTHAIGITVGANVSQLTIDVKADEAKSVTKKKAS